MAKFREEIEIVAADKTGPAFASARKGLLGLDGAAASLSSRLSGLVNPFTLAAAAAAGLTAAVFKTAAAGEEMLKFSAQTGIAVEKLGGLKYAAELSETNIETLMSSLAIFARGLAGVSTENSNVNMALAQMGIETLDVNGKLKNTNSILLEVASKFATYEASANKSALSNLLFGRRGHELISMLNLGTEGLEGTQAAAVQLGLTFTEKTAVAADQFGDNLRKLKGHVTGLSQTIANPLMKNLNVLFEMFSGKGVKEFRLDWLNTQIENYEKIVAKGAGRLFGPTAARIEATKKELAEMKAKRIALEKELYGVGAIPKPLIEAPLIAKPETAKKEAREKQDSLREEYQGYYGVYFDHLKEKEKLEADEFEKRMAVDAMRQGYQLSSSQALNLAIYEDDVKTKQAQAQLAEQATQGQLQSMAAFGSILESLNTIFQGKYKALFYLMRGVQAAQAIMFGFVAAGHVGAQLGIFGIPLGPLLIAQGFASAAAIMAQTFMGPSGGGGAAAPVSAFSGGAGGGYAPVSPAASTQKGIGSLTINILGDHLDPDKLVEKISGAIEDAIGDRRLNVSTAGAA